jgi:hypothetical protein
MGGASADSRLIKARENSSGLSFYGVPMNKTILLTILLVLLFLLWWVYTSHNLPGFYLPDPDIPKILLIN